MQMKEEVVSRGVGKSRPLRNLAAPSPTPRTHRDIENSSYVALGAEKPVALTSHGAATAQSSEKLDHRVSNLSTEKLVAASSENLLDLTLYHDSQRTNSTRCWKTKIINHVCQRLDVLEDSLGLRPSGAVGKSALKQRRGSVTRIPERGNGRCSEDLQRSAKSDSNTQEDEFHGLTEQNNWIGLKLGDRIPCSISKFSINYNQKCTYSAILCCVSADNATRIPYHSRSGKSRESLDSLQRQSIVICTTSVNQSCSIGGIYQGHTKVQLLTEILEMFKSEKMHPHSGQRTDYLRVEVQRQRLGPEAQWRCMQTKLSWCGIQCQNTSERTLDLPRTRRWRIMVWESLLWNRRVMERLCKRFYEDLCRKWRKEKTPWSVPAECWRMLCWPQRHEGLESAETRIRTPLLKEGLSYVGPTTPEDRTKHRRSGQAHGQHHWTRTMTNREQKQTALCMSIARCRRPFSRQCGNAKMMSTWQTPSRHHRPRPPSKQSHYARKTLTKLTATHTSYRRCTRKQTKSIACPDGVVPARPRTVLVHGGSCGAQSVRPHV